MNLYLVYRTEDPHRGRNKTQMTLSDPTLSFVCYAKTEDEARATLVDRYFSERWSEPLSVEFLGLAIDELPGASPKVALLYKRIPTVEELRQSRDLRRWFKKT